jgi:hypothetical protein
MTFAIIKTSAGYMVMNSETGDYVNDEDGNNTFDDLKEAQNLYGWIRIVWAIRVKEDAK